MANAAPKAEKPVSPKYLVPEGLKKHTGDVVGFHDLEDQGPIHGIPRGAKLSDSSIDDGKPSAFVIFELLAPTECTEGAGDDAVTVKAVKGDMVGVWMKGGMRSIRNLGDREVFMVHTGEKKLRSAKPGHSPMKTYDFHVGAGKPKLIPVIEDNREKSAGQKTPFDIKVKKAPGREPGDDADEDLDF